MTLNSSKTLCKQTLAHANIILRWEEIRIPKYNMLTKLWCYLSWFGNYRKTSVWKGSCGWEERKKIKGKQQRKLLKTILASVLRCHPRCVFTRPNILYEKTTHHHCTVLLAFQFFSIYSGKPRAHKKLRWCHDNVRVDFSRLQAWYLESKNYKYLVGQVFRRPKLID